MLKWNILISKLDNPTGTKDVTEQNQTWLVTKWLWWLLASGDFISLDQSLWCHWWSLSHPERAVRKERSLSRPGGGGATMLCAGSMVATDKPQKTSFSLWDKKKQGQKSQDKALEKESGWTKIFMFPSPAAREHCAPRLSHSTLPSEPHMACLGRKPDTSAMDLLLCHP